MQYISFAQLEMTQNEESAHMENEQKNRRSGLMTDKSKKSLKVWLAAGFTTLCSVGANNVSEAAALLA